MIFVYIILGIIVILFITVIILAIGKYNNEVVNKELEYVSENYNVDEINEQNKILNESINVSTVKATPIKPVVQTQPVIQEQPVVQEQTVVETSSVVSAAKPALQEPVDNTPPPIINLKIPEQTDEEISIIDTAIKEESQAESIEVKDNALKEEETGDEINIVDNSLKVEESGDAAVVIPEATLNPAPVIQKVEVPKDVTDYKSQAFNNTFDGNTTINKDIKIESPEPKDLNKTEIWDMSEVRSVVNSNEKN